MTVQKGKKTFPSNARGKRGGESVGEHRRKTEIVAKKLARRSEAVKMNETETGGKGRTESKGPRTLKWSAESAKEPLDRKLFCGWRETRTKEIKVGVYENEGPKRRQVV